MGITVIHLTDHGWSNENMGPTVLILSLVVMLSAAENKKIPVWMYLGNISCLAGSILMIVAPGNFVRSGRRRRHPGNTVEPLSAC